MPTPTRDILGLLVLKFQADKITEAREAAGKTKTQLARAVGATRTTAERWESGRFQIKLPLLARICKVLDVSPRSTLPSKDELAALRSIAKKIEAECPKPPAEMSDGAWEDFVDDWTELETVESRNIRERLERKAG